MDKLENGDEKNKTRAKKAKNAYLQSFDKRNYQIRKKNSAVSKFGGKFSYKNDAKKSDKLGNSLLESSEDESLPNDEIYTKDELYEKINKVIRDMEHIKKRTP